MDLANAKYQARDYTIGTVVGAIQDCVTIFADQYTQGVRIGYLCYLAVWLRCFGFV